MNSQIFKVQLQGLKSIGLNSYLYHWKYVETQMSKMASHRPFRHLKHKLSLKKGWESNWQFDSRPLNVRNQSDFVVCRQCATCCWKTVNQGYNFASNLIVIEGLHAKLCAPKVVGVPVVGISKFPLGSPGTKSHLDVGPVERHKVYYKGEGGGFPQVWAMVNLVSPSCPWFVLTPKVLQLCTNHFVLVLCRFV